MEDKDLAALVRAMCDDGRLPVLTDTVSALGGRGGGRRTCEICGEHIGVGMSDVLVALESRLLWLHLMCFQVWARESRDRPA